MTTYVTSQGDCWDSIAKKVYGSEKHADYLMQNNIILLDTLVFPGNVYIDIPDLTQAQIETYPAWRRM